MTDKPTVLVVDDEPQLRRFLRASLGSHGYQLLEAVTGAEALSLAASHRPDVILLDLGLPDADGIDITRQLRGWTTTPIIVISARGQEEDKVAALDAGADDYLTKPFGVGELLARLRVALRHLQSRGSSAPAVQVLEFPGLRLDLVRREVRAGDDIVHLTPLEYKLLVLLARNAGKVLTHRQILKEVWGEGAAQQTHTVRVHLAELRKKIEPDSARPRLIVTEPGVGYRFRDS